MTSSVEIKENEGDDDMYDMFEIYEQCEYILWSINVQQKQTNKEKKPRGHTDKNHSNMDNKK